MDDEISIDRYAPMTRNSPSKRDRLFSIDMLRGLLIVLMALDHANYHVAQQHSTGEYWGGQTPVYPTLLHYLTRFVTHLSAPGFFFLLGIGMIFFTHSRLRKGWSWGKISRHFLVRGSMLILLQIAFVNLIWLISPLSFPRWYIGVLVALGAGMILCIPLLKVKPVYLAGIALALFISQDILTPSPDLWGLNFDYLPGILLVYGGGQGHFWVNYPLIAWLEVIVFGLFYGKWILDENRSSSIYNLTGGFVFLVVFLVLRLNNGFGNIRSYQPGSWTEFFNLVKYPPSMTFILFTLGVNLILLEMFSKIRPEILNPGNPLLVFGRAPLFSYLAHMGIYAILGRILTPQGSGLLVMYVLWVLGLGILYPMARWYGMYKESQPEGSWVRFF
jgi:uncharacterized membrane protein